MEWGCLGTLVCSFVGSFLNKQCRFCVPVSSIALLTFRIQVVKLFPYHLCHCRSCSEGLRHRCAKQTVSQRASEWLRQSISQVSSSSDVVSWVEWQWKPLPIMCHLLSHINANDSRCGISVWHRGIFLGCHVAPLLLTISLDTRYLTEQFMCVNRAVKM